MDDAQFKAQVIATLTFISHAVDAINTRLDRCEDNAEGYSNKIRGSEEIRYMQEEVAKLGKLFYGDGN